MPRSNANIGQKERAAARRLQSLELRRAGASYRQIADRLGISEGQAFNDVKREIARIADASSEVAAEVRALELDRMDTMLLGLWPDARKGHLGAVDRVLRIMERRASLLGLDAPKQQDIRLEHLDVIIGGS